MAADFLPLGYADDTILTAESEEELKSLLMKVKVESEKVGLKLNFFTLLFHFHQEESEKVGLKLNIQKMKIMASDPSLHGK